MKRLALVLGCLILALGLLLTIINPFLPVFIGYSNCSSMTLNDSATQFNTSQIQTCQAPYSIPTSVAGIPIAIVGLPFLIGGEVIVGRALTDHFDFKRA